MLEYYICDIGDVELRLKDYIQTSMRLYLKRFLDDSDSITYDTFAIALSLV